MLYSGKKMHQEIEKILYRQRQVAAIAKSGTKSDLEMLLAAKKDCLFELKSLIETQRQENAVEKEKIIADATEAASNLSEEISLLEADLQKKQEKKPRSFAVKFAIGFAIVQAGFLSAFLALYFLRQANPIPFLENIFNEVDKLGPILFVGLAVAALMVFTLMPVLLSMLMERMQK